MKRKKINIFLVALVAVACTEAPSEVDYNATTNLSTSTKGNAFHTVWDDFQDGFTVTSSVTPNPSAKWFFFDTGPIFVGDDGIVTTSSQGLKVVSSGTNAITGEPAFTKTLGQEGAPDNPFFLPGGIDHVKWLAYMNTASSSGFPGFDAVDGQELSYEAWVGGRSFGNDGHPFASTDVIDPDDDLRLGSVAMNTIDFETFMVFDFFLTNSGVYVFYERLPFGRATLGNYAAFSYQIRVADRRPNDVHHLQIAYDRSAGVVRWLMGGNEVFRVDRVGQRIDNKYLTIDHGGVEPNQPLVLNQLSGGMGMFTLLDGQLPSGNALVRLSNAGNFYFDPVSGEPNPQTFADETSEPSSRLFGQGAELTIRRYVVVSRPSQRSSAP